MTRRALSDAGTPLVTSLPTSPGDGEVVDYLADATNGVVWRFRYRAIASVTSYKTGTGSWEFVGGGPLRSWDNNNYSVTLGTGFYQPASASVYVTVPLIGDYEASFGNWFQGPAGSADVWTAVRVGSATAVDANGVDMYVAAGNIYASLARTVFVSVTTAPAALSLEHRCAQGNINVNRRFIAVRPVRVG
jgi:hypothetical protein